MRRTKGQKGAGFDLTPFSGKIPPAVRVVDHALAVNGWGRSARIRIINALKHGRAETPIVDLLKDDTCEGSR
jgi:hypothetical protein